MKGQRVVEFDPRFVELHPRTARWWAERSTCRACAHHLRDERVKDRGGERCALSTVWIGCRDRGRRIFAYCIDTREPGASCGPEAALFTPKE